MRLFILILLLLVAACEKHTEGDTMTPTTIKIKVGEAGALFLQRNNLPAKGHINKQPAGLNFYNQDWSTVTPGTVIVEHGAYSFQIPYALGVMGTEDVEHMSAGLAEFNINAGITAADTIMHDEARQKIMALLQQMLTLGWKPVISYEVPRLTGEQAYIYTEQENYFLDMPTNYTPTLEQWMRIDSGNWQLYADDIFLEIGFNRDSKRMNPNELGAYLLSFELISKEAKAKNQFEGDDREHWQDLWVDKIKSMKKERYAKEKELIQRGFTIYTEYQEPKIHPADPVEP